MDKISDSSWGVVSIASHEAHPYDEVQTIRLSEVEAFGRTNVYDFLHMRSGREFKFPAGTLNIDALSAAITTVELGEAKTYHFDKAIQNDMIVKAKLQSYQAKSQPQIVPVGPTLIKGK